MVIVIAAFLYGSGLRAGSNMQLTNMDGRPQSHVALRVFFR